MDSTSKAQTLTDIAMGYSRSRAVTAAARLGVADALGDGQRSVEELAALCKTQPEPLYRLLRYLASFGVVAEMAPKEFALTAFGQPLRRNVDKSEWSAIAFWGDLLADSWSHLTECIRSGDRADAVMKREGVSSRWSKDPDARNIFMSVMGTAPSEDYASIVSAWNFSGFRTVADLGGGGGALLIAVLTAYPHLNGMLVDRPESIERAGARFESNKLTARCRLIGADLCQSVPDGADVCILKHVLHGYGDADAVKILQHCLKAIPQNGRVLLIEFVVPNVVDHVDEELERRLMSDLNMLAVTGGRERSAIEWKILLDKAGYACRNITPVAGDLVSIIEAAPRC